MIELKKIQNNIDHILNKKDSQIIDFRRLLGSINQHFLINPNKNHSIDKICKISNQEYDLISDYKQALKEIQIIIKEIS